LLNATTANTSAGLRHECWVLICSSLLEMIDVMIVRRED
jgi:hypothetical protein